MSVTRSPTEHEKRGTSLHANANVRRGLAIGSLRHAGMDCRHPGPQDDGSLPEDGLRLLIEEAKKAAKVSREIASSEVVDLSILREAQKELGIK